MVVTAIARYDRRPLTPVSSAGVELVAQLLSGLALRTPGLLQESSSHS